jgi:SAM-dependent methyltransferase
MLDTLQQLYAAGAEVDWRGFDASYARRIVPAPTYPFQRRRHWVDLPETSRGPDTVQRWTRLAEAMDRQADRGPLDLNASSYPAKYECLARITAAHAVRTLREAGLFLRPGERHGVEDLMAGAGIAATYRHLMQRWLESLADRGLLRRDGDKFIADAPLPEPGLDALWQEADRLFADNRPLLDYVRHCGTLVGDVLRGRESPLETLFPGGSFDLAQGLYERSSTMLYINQLAAAAFEVLGLTAGAGQALRVLEVGAGTGGTSSSLLKVLPPDRTDYLFSDVSEAFLDRARERFAGRAGLRFGLFDLEKDAGAQGFAPASLDAIVSANAVHAVKDLRAGLSRLRELLAPGGVLVLVESTEHLAYFDMTTGLIEGWQHFADDLRGDNPLLAPGRWLEALRDAGFEEARAWPPAGSPAVALGQHVIVARVKGEALPAAVQGATSSDVATGAAGTPAKDEEQAARVAQIAAAGAAERRELLRELVRSQVMQVLRVDPSTPPSMSDRLMSLGMDSLMAVQLRNRLNRALALAKSLPSTLMFDYPTIDAIALHLAQRFEESPAAKPAAGPAAAAPAVDAGTVAAMSDEEIARLLDERVGAR